LNLQTNRGNRLTANNNYIAALLHKVGLLTPEEAEQALQRARLEKRHLIDLLVDDGNDHFEILSHLAAHSGMEAKRIDPKTVPAEAHEWMDAEIARRYSVAPLERQGSQLSVALSNPLDLETIDTLHYLLKYDIHPVITLPETIQALQTRLYPPQADAASAHLIQRNEPDHTAALLSTDINESEEEEPIIRLVNLLIIEGFRQRASDIHLEPLQRQFRVRYRIDGVLREVEGPPRRLHPSVISRIKIMSGMKISEKRLPQDGRIEIKVMGRELDLRVSAIPTNHGESMVLRILNKESLILGLPNLGFLDEDRRSFESSSVTRMASHSSPAPPAPAKPPPSTPASTP
jgi:type IV pilus assembly protein PilB